LIVAWDCLVAIAVQIYSSFKLVNPPATVRQCHLASGLLLGVTEDHSASTMTDFVTQPNVSHMLSPGCDRTVATLDVAAVDLTLILPHEQNPLILPLIVIGLAPHAAEHRSQSIAEALTPARSYRKT
jgi:hypothetical protein